MIKKAIHFIKYNNAFTIGMMIFLFGFGVTFAAGPAVVGAVYSSSESVTSIDNHALLAADLDTFDVHLKIDAATEDTQNYYVTYSYATLAIQDGVWQPVPMSKVLTVSKEVIADQDLGLYVAKQLSDNMKAELSYLKRVQVLAKASGESSKIVTTEYSGLVGKLLDPKSEVIAGYTPVIPAPVAAPVAPVAAASVAVDPDPSLFVENTPGYVKPAPVQSSAASPVLSEADIKRIIDQYLAGGSAASASSTPATTPAVEPSDPGSTPPPTDVPPPPPVDATTTPPDSTASTTPPTTPAATTTPASVPSTDPVSTSTPPATTPPADAATTSASSTQQ